jgi:hypothetical protein
MSLSAFQAALGRILESGTCSVLRTREWAATKTAALIRLPESNNKFYFLHKAA